MVFDIGSYSTRLGVAGEDLPKVCILKLLFELLKSKLFKIHLILITNNTNYFTFQYDIPSAVAYDENYEEKKDTKKSKHSFGDVEIRVPREGVQIQTFLEDGMSSYYSPSDKNLN